MPCALIAVSASCLLLAGCAAAHAGEELPSPRAAARSPVSDFAPSATGPGLGPELVFARGATLAGNTLTLAPAGGEGPALAIVRWLALSPGLQSDLAFATPSAAEGPLEIATAPPGATRWSFAAAPPDLSTWEGSGTLLLAARNPSEAVATIELALTFSASATLPAWAAAKSFPVTALEEPSGIDVDHKRGRLWVVDDGGVLGRVHPETGEVEAKRDFDPLMKGPADLEAVRWVPGLDVLLAVNEAKDQLLVVAPDSLDPLATASLVYSSGLSPVPTSGGDGIEGLAVTAVSGRTVHLVLANQNDPHALYEAELTLPAPITGALTATVTAAHPLPPVNLTEVMFDWGSRRLFVLHGYAAPPRLTRLRADWTEEASTPLPSPSSEGAALQGGALWIANDLGGITRATAR